MAVAVKLEAFEGPLDLLLHLIDKNKVNIYDIPIVSITDQYMEYLHAMEEADLNVMSEFLLMAATLLEIKCRMLLPPDVNEETGEEEDPRAELVQRLIEYKLYKSMSYTLKDREIETGIVAFRDEMLPEEVASYKPPVDYDALLSDVTLGRLQGVFRDVVLRNRQKIDPVRSKFGTIEQEEVSVDEKINWLRSFSEKHETFSFYQLLDGQHSRLQIVVTFLAVLELIKSGVLCVKEDGPVEEIEIRAVRAKTSGGS